jgi:predicted DNA-binding transcriptional regulator AlpA
MVHRRGVVLLGVLIASLYYWRHRGEGPPSSRLGRHVRYRAEDVRAWVAGRASRSDDVRA